jgi:hypothetical protein
MVHRKARSDVSDSDINGNHKDNEEEDEDWFRNNEKPDEDTFLRTNDYLRIFNKFICLL